MADVRDYLTLQDIAKQATEEAGSELNLKSIMEFIKDVSDAFKNAQGLVRTFRGEPEPIQQFSERPSEDRRSQGGNRPPVAPPMSQAEMLDKGVEILEFILKSMGDMPLSQVVTTLKSLKGPVDGNQNDGKTNNDIGIAGVGKNLPDEVSAVNAAGSSDLRSPSGVQSETIQSVPPSSNP